MVWQNMANEHPEHRNYNVHCERVPSKSNHGT